MIRSTVKTATLITFAALALGACDMHDDNDGPRYGELSRHLILVGTDGKNYGTMDLDPLGGGKVYDATGKQIGIVVRPAP